MEFKNLKYSILGLDNAGKSSLVYAFQRIYGFEDFIRTIPPTVRIKRDEYTLLDYQIQFWDFGGQMLYREGYVESPLNVFENTNILLYLIDLQDDARYQEYIDYLSSILRNMREKHNLSSMRVNICFSKCDSDALHGSMLDYKDRIDMIKILIEQSITDFKFSYFTTSIYNLFSIVRLFSCTLQEFFLISQELQNLLKSYRTKVPFEEAFLINKNGFAFANLSDILPDNLDLESKSFDFMNYYLRIYKQLENSAIPIPYLVNRTSLYDIVCYQFCVLSQDECIKNKSKVDNRSDLLLDHYYLTIFCDNKLNIVTANKELPKIVEEIKGVLRKYIESCQ